MTKAKAKTSKAAKPKPAKIAAKPKAKTARRAPPARIEISKCGTKWAWFLKSANGHSIGSSYADYPTKFKARRGAEAAIRAAKSAAIVDVD